jgi:hypothetical protein
LPRVIAHRNMRRKAHNFTLRSCPFIDRTQGRSCKPVLRVKISPGTMPLAMIERGAAPRAEPLPCVCPANGGATIGRDHGFSVFAHGSKALK